MAQIKKHQRGAQIQRIEALRALNDALLENESISEDAKELARRLRAATQAVINSENFTPRDKLIYQLGMAQAINNALNGKQVYSETLTGGADKNIFGYYSKRDELPWMINETARLALSTVDNGSDISGYITPEDGSSIKDPYDWNWSAGTDFDRLPAGLDANKRIELFADTLIRNMQNYINGDFSNYIVHGADEADKSNFVSYIQKLNALKSSNLSTSDKLLALNEIVSYIGEKNSSILDAYDAVFAPELDNSEEATASRAALEAAAAAKREADAAEVYGGTLPEGYSRYTPTGDTQAYVDRLKSRGYILGVKDSKIYAFKNNTLATSDISEIIDDFTSPIYNHGIIIGSGGQVYWGSDLNDLRTRTGDAYNGAYSRRDAALKAKYPTLPSQYIGINLNLILREGELMVDLSNYIQGDDVIIGLIPADDPDPYNWSTNKRFYKLDKTDPTKFIPISWDSIKDKFSFSGRTDNDSNPNNDEGFDNQFRNTFGYSEKPADWDAHYANSSLYTGTNTPNVCMDYNGNTFVSNDNESDEQRTYREKLGKDGIDFAYSIFLLDMIDNPAGAEKKWAGLIGNILQVRNMEDWYTESFKNRPVDEQKAILKFIYNKFKNNLKKSYKQILFNSWNGVTSAKHGAKLIQKFAVGGLQNVSKSSSNTSSNTESDNTNLTNNYENYYSESQAKYERASRAGLSMAGLTKNESTDILDNWSYSDWMRVAALTSDVAGLISSFFVGGGTAAAAGFGAASLGLDLTADIADDSVSKGQVVWNAAGNLLFGVLGLIPGGKTWKIIKGITMAAPALYTTGNIGIDLYNKINTGQELTYQDWKDIYAGLSTLVNLGTMGKSASKLKSLSQPEGKFKKGYLTFTDRTSGKSFDLSDVQIKKINEIGEKLGTAAALAELKSYVPEDIKETLDIDFNFGTVKDGDSRSKAAAYLRKKFGKNSPLKGDPAIQEGFIDRVAEFYKTNPRRAGNPFDATWGDPKKSIPLPKFLRSDYEIARQGKMPIGNPLASLDWQWVKAANLWRLEHLSTHGPKYAAATQDMASVRHANGQVTTKPVKKGNILIDIDNTPVEVSKVNIQGIDKSQNPNNLVEIVKSENGKYYGKDASSGSWREVDCSYDDTLGKFVYKLKTILHSAAASSKNGGKLDRLAAYSKK